MTAIEFPAPNYSKYPSPGYCIYCGATGVPLTSEHILPFFTGGTLELLGSSCYTCNKTTSRIDGYCANRVMNGFRHSHGLQSRTKSKPKSLDIQFTTPKGRVVRKVPFDEAPHILLMPEYDVPGMLVSAQPNGIVTPRSMRFWAGGDFQSRVQKLLQPGDTGWNIPSGGNFELFLRFIAKSALAGAVAMLGYDARKSPLGGAILGKNKTLRFYVGGDDPPPAEPIYIEIPPLTSDVSQLGFQNWALEGRPTLLVANVTFFKKSNMPTYLAVVGEATAEPETLLRQPLEPQQHKADKTRAPGQ